MNTLNLREAAELLKIHPVTLGDKARSGEIPGAKIGKAWVFVDIDLIDYIRAQYQERALQGGKETLCHSTNAKTRLSTGLKSVSVDEQYNAVLGPLTKSKPRNTTTR